MIALSLLLCFLVACDSGSQQNPENTEPSVASLWKATKNKLRLRKQMFANEPTTETNRFRVDRYAECIRNFDSIEHEKPVLFLILAIYMPRQQIAISDELKSEIDFEWIENGFDTDALVFEDDDHRELFRIHCFNWNVSVRRVFQYSYFRQWGQTLVLSDDPLEKEGMRTEEGFSRVSRQICESAKYVKLITVDGRESNAVKIARFHE